jgi:hypothetical protein
VNRNDMKRVRQLATGLLIGITTSWIIVGGYVLGVGYAMDHVGHSCRLGRHVATDLTSGFAWIGLAVSGVLVIAFLTETWKHEGVPEVGEWGSHMRVLLLWFVIANGLVFLLLAIWVGCGAWSLIR